MVNAEAYFAELKARLLSAFGARLCYLGMQGSYLRGEATEASDIDAMVILDAVDRADLNQYRAVIRSMPYAVEPCGFLCSRADMAAWNPMEIGQLRLTTRDVHGCLDDLLPAHARTDDIRCLQMSVNNLYHGLVHGFIYGEQGHAIEALPQHGKSLFFILQMLHKLRTGEFCLTHAALAEALSAPERALLAMTSAIQPGAQEGEAVYDALLAWCQRTMQELAQMN